MTVIPKDSLHISDSVKKDQTRKTSKKEDFKKVLNEETGKIDGASSDRKITAAGKKDEATLSEKSKEMAIAKKAIDATPDIREELVAEIKKEIKEGVYEYNLDALVEKLIDSGVFDDLV